jgi:hypothetical protein
MPEQRPQIPPVDGRGTTDEDIRDRVNRLLNGKMNVSAMLTVTLRPGQVTTTLVDERIGYFSHISLEPRTASAATARAALWYETAAGSATLHHASDAAVDQTMSYAVFG